MSNNKYHLLNPAVNKFFNFQKRRSPRGFKLSESYFRLPLFISYFLLFILHFLMLAACSTSADRFGSLDLVKWRNDRGGCKNVRKGLKNDFKSIEKEILGQHINKVGQLLGRPDIHQLGRRDQKFYIYFLEKGAHCNDMKEKSLAQKVILRFNSVGLLAEINFQAQPL